MQFAVNTDVCEAYIIFIITLGVLILIMPSDLVSYHGAIFFK